MEVRKNIGIHNTLLCWHSFKPRLIIESSIVGILSGLIIVMYRYAVELCGHFAKTIYSSVSHNWWKILLLFIALIFIAYLVGLMVKKEPMASGSGIPQVEGILSRGLSMNWLKVLLVKFFGGILCLAAGLSVGREGPSVQMGSAVGQGFSRITKRSKLEEKFLITGGASAGLSAAFNAPLSGVIFALEEVHKNFSPLVLLSAMSASLTADFVSKNFFGLKPVFNFNTISVLPLKYYFYLIIFGIIIGCFGVVFNKCITGTQDMYAKIKWLPNELKPAIAFITAGLVGLTLPELLGGGHELIMNITGKNITLTVLLIYLIIKFVFTMISFGSGVPGGIFLPLLVIGALTGDIFGNILVSVTGIDSQYITNFIILGMAGYFTAIVKAPITGAILITEMTGSFTHLLSLSIVSIIAYIVSDILNSKPVYETLLERFIKNKQKDLAKDLEENTGKTLMEKVVTMGSVADCKKIKNIEWPKGCLIVGIRRGAEEIIPTGNTTLYPGDYIVTLIDENNLLEISDTLSKLTEQI